MLPMTTMKFSENVALLAEGVDRNFQKCTRQQLPHGVALLAEGVDRNRLLAVI